MLRPSFLTKQMNQAVKLRWHDKQNLMLHSIEADLICSFLSEHTDSNCY